MLKQAVDFSTAEVLPLTPQELSEHLEATLIAIEPMPSPVAARGKLRTSLWASTLDGVFASVFSNIAGGVLLNNFLVELHATPMEIGMLSSIPMLVNLLQPLGAYLSDRTTSRHLYCLWIFMPARLLWGLLVLGIALTNWSQMNPHLLIQLALAIVLMSHLLGALGGASWLSWLATLVPSRLRGRYFGIRNSAASLTSLISLPLMGLAVSLYPGGTLQGYGVVLAIGIIAGLLSLKFQDYMVDVNPQAQKAIHDAPLPETSTETKPTESQQSIWQDTNFLMFLLYFGAWGFAINLSNPFFNLYLLDNLSLNVSWVTLYNSLSAAANLGMMILWGRIADRVGNRPILLLVGVGVSLTPLLWLGVSNNALSVWLLLPLLHMLTSGAWAGLDLCNNNLQMDIASDRHHSAYFAIAAAVAGVSGALGTTAGGFFAQLAEYGGLPSLFALSAALRLVALLPLVCVHEQRGHSIRRIVYGWLPSRPTQSAPAVPPETIAPLKDTV